MNMRKHSALATGAFVLAAGGMLTRLLGFFYRVFLSRTMGEEGLGIYQLSFTVAGFCYALCCGGISTAISKFVASHPSCKRRYLLAGLLLSSLISIPVSILIYVNASFISTMILHQSHCANLIRCLAFSIPLASFHGCANGYYLGQKKTTLPAFTQFIEQAAKIVAVYCIWLIIENKHMLLTPVYAMIGSLLGELVSVLVTVTALLFEKHRATSVRKKGSDCLTIGAAGKELTKMALPLSLNRVILTLLQSLEASLIPAMLCVYGMDSSDAFSIFGILTGMALPFILFPQSIIQAISSVLMPTVAEAGNKKGSIVHTVEKTLRFSLLTGILCTGLFTTYGHIFGSLLFHSESAGYFMIVLSWLCPFLYVSNTLASVLHGLGKTKITFVISMAVTAIKIAFIFFGIPNFGILAYLWGMLLSSILEAICLYLCCKKEIGLTISVSQMIIRPIYTIFIAIGVTFFIEHWILAVLPFSTLIINGISCGILAAIYGITLLPYFNS
jgi:stage V sporulation protein B